MRILLIEGDEREAEALSVALRRQGNTVLPVQTGAQALEHVHDCDLMLLGLGLPDLDGLIVCKRIRAQSPVPIIVISNPTGETDRVLGLDAGADDYITKPYSLHELRARMEAVMRRAYRCGCDLYGVPPSRAAEVLVVGPLRLDRGNRNVTLHGRPVQLARKEFDLLALLMEDPDTLLTREAIISRVWNEKWFGSTRTLDVHIGALRQKLGGYEWIETIRGIGFRLGSAPLQAVSDSSHV
jgi:DNA-binding response OmpR family regulator